MITGAQVQEALRGREQQVVDLVAETYRLHGRGETVNPPSSFLRFPDIPTSRIIGPAPPRWGATSGPTA